MSDVDPVFGPPATGAIYRGSSNRSCHRCQVAWHSDGQLEDYCWLCGQEGDKRGVSFPGVWTSYVDEPPRHMWLELGWTGEEAS